VSTPATSVDFVRSEELLVVALVAHKFACRPSKMIGLEDEALAFDFDCAAMLRLQEWQDQRENERWSAMVDTSYGSH
jgi:hypothetical protein